MSDAQKIISEIYTYIDYLYDELYITSQTKDILDKLIIKLEQELSKDTEVLGWIDVNDGLPDTVRSVLVYTGKVVGWAFFNSDKKWVDCGDCSFYEGITHWSELPKPPNFKHL